MKLLMGICIAILFTYITGVLTLKFGGEFPSTDTMYLVWAILIAGAMANSEK